MIEARITGRNVVLMVKNLESLDARALEAIGLGLKRGLDIARGVSMQHYLRGPRPQRLGTVTTRLLGSISTEVEIGQGRVIGRIGSNLVYAAYHEFGLHGTINISAHTRVTAQTTKGGHAVDTRRAVNDNTGRFVGFGRSRKSTSAGNANVSNFEQSVRAHTRNISYDGRPFIRPAIELSTQQIGSEINKEMKAL